MQKHIRFSRAWVSLAAVLVTACLFGQDCSSNVILPGPVFVPSTVTIELVNTTGAPVDPGLFVDAVQHIVDPPIAAGDSLAIQVPCYAGTRIQTDATQLTGFGPVASDNIAVVDQGADFQCGNTVSFVFAQDAAGFFTNVQISQ